MTARTPRSEVAPLRAAPPPDGPAQAATVRVIVVDDHALVREGTVQLLGQVADIEVVGQAGSGEDGLDVLDRTRPDVALVDVNLPGMSGLELARAAAASAPEVRVLIVSAYDDYAYVTEALDIGVGGYLLKQASGRDLVDAIRAVARGVFVLDRDVSLRLARRSRATPSTAGSLTPRESDVLALLARGRSNRLIAQDLGLGTRTVEGHVSAVLGKLGVASRTEAVAYALNHHLVDARTDDDAGRQS